MSDTVMSPVSQEIVESLSNSILIDSDSSSSSLGLLQNSTAKDDNGSVESMALQDECVSASDTEADSAIILLKCLNSESPSSSFVSCRNDNSAIIRLNNELLKAKRSNWEVVDALVKAYQDIKDLRVREQRLNAVLSNSTGKHEGTNGFPESLSLPEHKIIELQFALRREEEVKTREDLRALIKERDRLKEKLGKSESDRRLVTLTNHQRDRELELSQSHVKDLEANIKEKDSKILSTQNKLISLEEQMKGKDEEIEKIRDERNSLRDAVIRSEQEIEMLSEKLRNLLPRKEENKNPFANNIGRSFGIQTFDSVNKALNEEEYPAVETRLEREMRYLKSRHNQDIKVIHDLNSKLKEWERIVKSMNDYVRDTNQQQLKAREEIADHVKRLEQQLLEAKVNRPASIKELDEDLLQYSNELNLQHNTENTAEANEACLVRSQVADQNQPHNVDFKDYLKSSADLDKEGRSKELDDDDMFEVTNLPDDFSLASCFRSSTRHLVQPDNLRMARITTIEGFVSPHLSPKETNRDDSEIPKRPPRRKSSGKRRKLPEMRKTLSIGSALSTDSAVTQSDESVSVTSFESQFSRDTVGFRKGSRSESNRRLPPVPSGEEITIDRADVGAKEPIVEPPSVLSIYKAPNVLHDHRQDSGLSESMKTSPVSPGSSRRFSLSSLKKKFRKRRTSSGGVSRQSRPSDDKRRKVCLLLIFKYLNAIELCGVARVCREWREMSEHPALWKNVILEDMPLNNMALQAVSRKCSSMQFLKLKALKEIKRKKSVTSRRDNMSCYLERGLEFLLKAAGSILLSLHIEDCGIVITDRCLALASCHCRELQEIVYISDSFPACPEALWALWGCRKLTTLRVPPMCPSDHPGRFNDKSLETISNCWPNLRQLSVGGPSITSAGLIHIAKGCLRLQELELDRAILINEEIAHAMCLCGLRGLETISFTFTPVSPGAIKELLGTCSRLERIEVHIGISDYFMDVEDDASKRKYKYIIKKLTALQAENPEFERVLWIKADYG